MVARMTAWVAIALALGGGTDAARATAAPAPERAPAAQEAASWPPPGTRVEWRRPGPSPARSVTLKLLAFNDFHGNLEAPVRPGTRAAGGAAVLAAYLEAAARGHPGRTLLLHAGDIVGASPPISRLLRDEPSMDFLNLLAGPGCRFGMATQFFDAASARTRPDRCNMVGTLGNHEFDRGPQEILRLLDGGTASDGPFLDRVYRGVRIPYVCANVFDRRTGRTLLPPYAVASVGGVSVGVIGAVVRDTPHLVQAWAVADLEFRDEADAINAAAAELSAHGIHAIVVIIHQGVIPAPTNEPGAARDADGNAWHGLLAGIVARLDPAVDVVVSGHTHSYTNALLPDATGAPVLVTQAYSYGLAYADIDLGIDRRSGRVFAKSALIVPTWRDAGPGRRPDPRVLALTRAAAAAIAPRVARVVGEAAEPITRRIDAAGESALGDLVADAERAATGADIALVNAGGMRADLDQGPVTWGEILTLHPFGNRLVTLQLTGAQIRAVLEDQWREDPASIPQILKISGLSYVWDPAQPPGHRIVAACDAAHQPLDPARSYRVTINDFLAAGGDGFQSFEHAPAGVPGPTDAEALSAYIEGSHGPVERHIEGRIARADLATGALCPAPAAQP
jgi:5'-nucleotidase